MKNQRPNVRMLTVSAICLALCMILPFLTGQIPQIGSALSPMHIPVLLCGFFCGPMYAGAVGVIAPLLRSMLFGMPPLFPTGVAMCMELMTYGVVASVLYRRLPKKTSSIYAVLIVAMLCGRVVWGVAQVILLGMTGSAFTWAAFMAGAFTHAIPGIAVHILLIPIIVMTVEKATRR